jgi:hypothetical protein
VPQKIKFTKQYKPICFGDGPDPGTVEGTATLCPKWLKHAPTFFRVLTTLLMFAGTTSSVLGQFSHGTAVIAIPTGKQILFAADSAESRTGEATKYDACKIAKVDGKTIFIQAGLAGVGNLNFTDKAAELLKGKRIRTQGDLDSVAESWNRWVIAELNTAIVGPRNLFNASQLSPVEAIFATVDERKNVVFVKSTFKIVNVPILTSDPSNPNWLSGPQFANGHTPELKGYLAFGLRFGRSALDELRLQQTEWSQQNVAVIRAIDQPGTVAQKKAVAEQFMSIVSPWSIQADGNRAVGGDTDVILLGPKGAIWKSRKSTCREIWK